MGKRLYVGNLSYNAQVEELEQAFSKFGGVISVDIISDRHTGRSKGFGFIEMDTDENAERAASEMNGQEVGGRQLKVNIARPMEKRAPRSFNGPSRNGGGGSGGGGGGGGRSNNRW